MNKKVSTLLTVALTLGGSLLSSSAFAEKLPYGDPVKTLKSGDEYFFVQTNDGNNNAFGFSKVENKVITPSILKLTDDYNEEVGVDAYIWTVKKDSIPGSNGFKYIYKLTNKKTNQELLFDNASGKLVTSTDAVGTMAGVVLPDYAEYKELSNSKLLPWTLADNAGVTDRFLGLNGSSLGLFAESSAGLFSFYEIKDQDDQDVVSGELNELYNRQGFSFALSDDKVENIFSKKVYAYYTANRVELDSNKKLGFPAGTYIFTDLKLVDEEKAIDSANIDWLNSTFIVVSSTETEEVTKTAKEAGNGYIFVERKGSQLITDEYGTKSEGEQIPACNAAFSIVRSGSSSSNYKYGLKLANFKYNLPTKDDAKNHNAKSMYIGLTNHNGANFLTTDADASEYQFIFTKAQSTIKKGIELLSTDGTPAIYNIKFVSGQGEDSEYNKYLTVGVKEQSSNRSYAWVAEGAVLADKESPEYQFVITAVDKDNNITFTNRENGESITLQLFNEDNCYSVSAADKNVAIQAVTIDNNTYGVSKGDEFKLDASLLVLEPVTEIEATDGFLNVEDKSILTLAYARDNNTTSNKYYTVVDDKSGVYSFKTGNDMVTTEVSEAAQFQLIKSEKPVSLKRSYIYNDNGTITSKANGDVVSAYTYALRYVVDGTETEYFLKGNAGKIELEKTTVENAWPAVIKVNKDGSVVLVTTKTSGVFASEFDKDAFTAEATGAGQMSIDETTLNVSFGKSDIYPVLTSSEVIVKDNSLKTYLLSEAPEISWKAESGHVTLQSELSNYISMNEKREGIVVNESAETFYLHVTDKDAVVPSFYISQGIGENSNGESKRLFLFNPTDSVEYQVNQKWDPDYQWTEGRTKAIFKEGRLVSADTMETVVKGNLVNVSKKQNNTDGTLKGIEKFKYQIVETPEADGYYYIRQVNGDANKYLASWNEMLTWSEKKDAMKFHIEDASAPTSNESVSASEVAVVAQNGSVVVKNAAGKNVVVSTILGQVVANEVLTSDNAAINVPAGIVVVAVEGESFKVNVK